MVTAAISLVLAVASTTPSPTTLAAVKVFAANVDRDWPSDDDRAEAVTGEAFRLMSAAVRAMADDAKVDDAKLRAAIASFDAAREALINHPRGDGKRPGVARTALEDGRVMIDRLSAALGSAELTAKDREALKKIVSGFETNRSVREQADDLKKYFQGAARMMTSMLDAVP